jgi:threonine/homoserine/homoserine lactone efflux protein
MMDPTAALLAGLAAGLAIAVQVGAVSLLLIESALVAGPRAGVAAGMGVATVDFGYAAIAAAAGGAAGAALASHESEIRLFAAAVLAAIAARGLIALTRERRAANGRGGPVGRTALGGTGSARDRAGATHERAGPPADAASPVAHYGRFLALTAANPLTIASFAAVAASLSLGGLAAGAAFAVGAGVASAAWHVLLTVSAGHAGRWVTPRVQRGLAVGGRLAVLAIAVHLALAA